jgi:hypothetical protein
MEMVQWDVQRGHTSIVLARIFNPVTVAKVIITITVKAAIFGGRSLERYRQGCWIRKGLSETRRCLAALCFETGAEGGPGPGFLFGHFHRVPTDNWITSPLM